MKERSLIFLSFIFLIISCIAVCYIYYYNKWESNWRLCPKIPFYSINKRGDDTIRIGMIGDSWAYLHHSMHMDAFLCCHLSTCLRRPVTVESKGKNGEITREIYKFIFSYDKDGTKTIFDNGLDYCIISAGINDACKNLGIKQYVYHYRMIIDFLLYNDICPIVIEIPNANVWATQINKPINEIVVDYIRSIMTGSPFYDCAGYRNNLKKDLFNHQINTDVIYISLSEWNGTEMCISKEFSMLDQIHLNKKGYEKLDYAIMRAIIKREQGK